MANFSAKKIFNQPIDFQNDPTDQIPLNKLKQTGIQATKDSVEISFELRIEDLLLSKPNDQYEQESFDNMDRMFMIFP